MVARDGCLVEVQVLSGSEEWKIKLSSKRPGARNYKFAFCDNEVQVQSSIMGAAPSHEEEGVDDDQEQEDDDIIPMKHGTSYLVSHSKDTQTDDTEYRAILRKIDQTNRETIELCTYNIRL